MKEDVLRDDIEREIDTKLKQQEFKREMQQMQEQKRLKAEIEKEIKHNETYDYFPFTHGENIDTMKENYKRVVLSSMRTHVNKSRLSSSDRSVDKGKSTAINLFSRTGLNNPLSNEYTIENQRLKRFRSTERHPQVIKSALERFENSLLKREKEKLQEEQDFRDQVAHNQQYASMIKEKVEKERKQNRENLLRHMNENRIQQLKQTLERKKYLRTNYGPEESDYTFIIQAQKKEADREELKQELSKQISNKIQLKSTKQIDKQEELKDIQKNNDIITALKNEASTHKKDSIKNNVEMWDIQTNMKKRAEDLLYI